MIEKTKFNFFYFDLEDTIINEYVNKEVFINVEKVLAFIEDNNIDSISIFSFAMQNSQLIYHFDDNLQYNKSLRQRIEEKFNIKIYENISLDDMIRKSSKLRRLDTIPRRDYFIYFSKQQAFIDMVRYKMRFCNETDSTFTLLDDMVENVTLYYPKNNIYIRLVNVNSL